MTRGPERPWHVEQRTGDETAVLYGMVDEPVPASEVVMANHFTSTHPSSPFVGQLVAIRKDDDAFVRLRGRTRLAERPDGRQEERELRPGETAAALIDEVGVPLPDAAAAALEAALAGLP